MKKITLREYASLPETVFLGTADSYGVEQLVVRRGTGWEDMQIIATFETPEGKSVDVVLADGSEAEVPPEATAGRDGKGKITFVGYRDGERRIAASVTTILYGHGPCSADADKAPTPDLVQQILAAAEEAKQAAKDAAEDAAKAGPYAKEAKAAQEAAEQARDDAVDARQEAEAAAEAAENSRAAAETLEETARRAALAAEHAKAAAVAAANSAGEDAAAAQQAAEQAANAQSAAEEAQSRAESAKKAAEDAKAAAVDAQGKAEQAAGKAAAAQKKAEDAAVQAETLAKRAETAASTATAAASTASAAATNAGNSATAAAQSKAAAETAAKAAQEAQAAAAAAKADAVKAQTAAQAAAKTAQDAKSAAEKARDDAQTARQGAEDARDAAAGSAEAAARSEENAKQSADTLAESVENVAANTAAVAELREKKAEIDDSAVGADAWSSKHIVDMLCPGIKESGNPVQCYPVAGYPLGVTASWEPVQEGEGEPYPAGGGKNLLNFPENTVLKGTGDTELEFPFDLNGDYVFSFKGNVKVVEIGSALWMFEIDGVQKYIVADSGMESLALSGHITKVALTNWGKCTGTILWAQLEKGSTPTAYAPYENIRPFVGRDSVTVERCGENVIELVSPYGNNSNATIAIDEQMAITINGTTIEKNNINIMKCRLHWKAGEKYTMFVKKLGGSCKIGDGTGITFAYSLFTEDYNKFFRGDTGAISMDRYTATSEALNETELIFMLQCWRPGTVFNNFKIQIAVVQGTVAPENYEPYTGQTNTLTLPETIYGGSVDAVSSEGQETWKTKSFDGTEGWNLFNTGDKNQFFYTTKYDFDETIIEIICSHFSYVRLAGKSVIRIYTTMFTDADVFKSYLAAQYAAGTPVQVCYKLATPTPFTATGGAALPALAGVNTVLTDADSVEVTGRADPIKRIEDLEAAVASIN